MSEENHMGWKLVKGVRRDVINLFKLFANANSVRFEDFSKVWQQLNFSLIYTNRYSFVEILEFSEELLQIVKEFLSSVYEFHTRIAAIYALYGLYFKQPIRNAAKIRFIKTEWEDVYSLIEKCRADKHYDVAFIFYKLYLNGAFNFTATIRTAGFERGYRKYSEKRSGVLSKVCDVELLHRPLITDKLVNSLVKLESLYCKKKSELLGSKNLVFIDGSFAQSLKEELQSYALSCENKINPTNNDKTSKDKDSEVSSNSPTNNEGKKSKRRKSVADADNLEIANKKSKITKKYVELLAKKKAEFYIRKLQSENGASDSGEKILSFTPLFDSDNSDPEN